MSSNERKDERGLVSFMITLIMMMVITLIVIGFTQVVNRNRRITLDRQLSAQAFYAAESGINDVVKQIKTDGYTVQSQTNCTSGYYASKLVYKLNSGTSTDVAYTCVLVNPVVPDIRTQASAAESKVVDIEPSDANSTNLTPIELTFTWSAATGASSLSPAGCVASAGQFVPSASYNCPYGLLRVDLMQYTPGGTATTASGLNSSTATFFMQPLSSSPGSYSFNNFGAQKANIVGAVCNTATNPGRCTATLSLGASARSQYYFARITALYKDAPLVIIDSRDVSKNAWFKNQQAQIDVTGRAQDVLKRIQARVELNSKDTSNLPLGGIQSSGAVCKRFTNAPGSGNYTPEPNCP